MKVIVEEKGNSIEFPCLMESTANGNIVLFFKDQEGAVIYGGSMSSPVGKYRED